jgi:hypothetical protein
MLGHRNEKYNALREGRSIRTKRRIIVRVDGETVTQQGRPRCVATGKKNTDKKYVFGRGLVTF